VTAPTETRGRLPATLVGVLVVLLLAAGLAAVALHRGPAAAGRSSPPTTTAPRRAGGRGGPVTVTTRPHPPEPAYVTEVKKQVAELRGLQWKEPLAVEVVPKDELARRYRAGAERDARPDRLAGDGETFHLLHVLPRDVDYQKIQEDLFASVVLGFYDPITKELVVGDAGGEADPGAKVTLAHELDHALTDQWFDFGGRTKALDDADHQEELDAFTALIEGDAKLLERRYADAYLSEDEQAVFVLGELFGTGDSTAAAKVAQAPPFLLDYIYFPYTQGLEFAKAQAEGRGNAGVDAAFRRPPTSTEQVLHPALYAADQGWSPPALPDVAAASGCQAVRRGTLGEFKMGEVLQPQLGESTATRAAAGWNGDSFQTVRCGTRLGMVERWQADSDADAARLAQALARWGPQWSRSRSAAGGRFSGPGGSGRVVQSGSRVDLVLADDAATADRLGSVA
jgi:hypothetical protein